MWTQRRDHSWSECLFRSYSYACQYRSQIQCFVFHGIFKGKDDAELVEALCARIDQLMHAVDVEPKLSANGVTKKAFDAAVDRLASLAYDDQCTPANPRQPYIEEMKQLLIDQF